MGRGGGRALGRDCNDGFEPEVVARLIETFAVAAWARLLRSAHTGGRCGALFRKPPFVSDVTCSGVRGAAAWANGT